MSLNSVNVMGNLTRDPEIRYTPAGKAVCNLSIANNRIYNKNGERQTEVSYFDVEVWGVIGENCAKYLSKGSGIIVEGRLRQDRWEKDGKTQSRVRIVANNIHFLAKKRDDSGAGGQNFSAPDAGPADVPSQNISPDSIAWDE
ncbi:MAG: single-stranded DNA-binding protein [Candidatus Omnitrophota bacterium]